MRGRPGPSESSASPVTSDGWDDRLPRAARAVLCLCLLSTTSCIDLGLGDLVGEEEPGVGGGTTRPGAFVIAGTMVEADSLRPCPVFQAENGVQYHLFQGDALSDSQFQSIATLGAMSTLEVVLRRDLDLRCQVDDVLEVLEVTAVLQVAPP